MPTTKRPASKPAAKTPPAKASKPILAPAAPKVIAAPKIVYQPRPPRRYRPKIGLIGCGGVTRAHLQAYRALGYSVVAMADPNLDNAAARARDFYPDATLYSNHHELLARPDIDVVDIATHPGIRTPLIRDALRAGKHVLSQKPFVLDLAEGRELVALARRKNLKLAVNQNGRWAPYFGYLRGLADSGHLGEINSIDMTLAWNHTAIRGTHMERVHHVILYDFAIHWFDIVALLFRDRPVRGVFASVTNYPGQDIAAPLNGQAAIEYEDGQATLAFRGHSLFTDTEHLLVTGTKGAFEARGRTCNAHDIRVRTARGEFSPTLEGAWFPEGMGGPMSELLRAIEENREPDNSAETNLRSLGLCFAALESTRTRRPELPGKVKGSGPGCSAK